MRSLIVFAVSISLAFISQVGFSQDLLLEDYEGNGSLTIADWSSTQSDSEGNANVAKDDGEHATVAWATQWSGIPSTNYEDVMDLSKYKTYQVDVMVEEGQPVEEGANFYVQLLSETDTGYAYWESYIPQNLVPADGKEDGSKFKFKKCAFDNVLVSTTEVEKIVVKPVLAKEFVE